MKNDYRKLERFEENLAYTINSYNEGNCDLEAVIEMADKVACYKANKGINTKRLPHNEREMAFYEQWQEENAPISGHNNGHGILQDLFIESDTMGFRRKVVEEISNRDRMIVATVVQWLGSNCGMCFLDEALGRFGAKIVYDKKETTE
jgi:hypothetical protein